MKNCMTELKSNIYDVIMIFCICISMLGGRNCLQGHIVNLTNLLFYCLT
jgi:hypothetical protein